MFVPRETDTAPVVSERLPTLNDAASDVERIEREENAIVELRATGKTAVSDSSDDWTPGLARNHGTVVVGPDEPGDGSVYRHAFEHVRGEYVVVGDADCTFDYEELPKLYQRISAGNELLFDGG